MFYDEVLSKCKKCIHFDVCYKRAGNIAKYCAAFQDKADVVPRSEVEKFIQEIDQIQKDKAEVTYLKEQLITKAKQEVAKQIFEEIESLVAKYIDISIQTKSITSELNFEDMETDLAELKKKYIGEEKVKLEEVKCKDCKHLMFSDFDAECSKGYRGIVRPNDTCPYGEKENKWE